MHRAACEPGYTFPCVQKREELFALGFHRTIQDPEMPEPSGRKSAFIDFRNQYSCPFPGRKVFYPFLPQIYGCDSGSIQKTISEGTKIPLLQTVTGSCPFQDHTAHQGESQSFGFGRLGDQTVGSTAGNGIAFQNTERLFFRIHHHIHPENIR